MVFVNHNLIVHETQQSNFFVVKLLLLYRCSNARIRRIDAPLQDKMLAAMRDVPYVRIFCCEWLPLCMRKRTYLSHTTKIDWCFICVCDTHETPKFSIFANIQPPLLLRPRPISNNSFHTMPSNLFPPCMCHQAKFTYTTFRSSTTLLATKKHDRCNQCCKWLLSI